MLDTTGGHGSGLTVFTPIPREKECVAHSDCHRRAGVAHSARGLWVKSKQKGDSEGSSTARAED